MVIMLFRRNLERIGVRVVHGSEPEGPMSKTGKGMVGWAHVYHPQTLESYTSCSCRVGFLVGKGSGTNVS